MITLRVFIIIATISFSYSTWIDVKNTSAVSNSLHRTSLDKGISVIYEDTPLRDGDEFLVSFQYLNRATVGITYFEQDSELNTTTQKLLTPGFFTRHLRTPQQEIALQVSVVANDTDWNVRFITTDNEITLSRPTSYPNIYLAIVSEGLNYLRINPIIRTVESVGQKRYMDQFLGTWLITDQMSCNPGSSLNTSFQNILNFARENNFSQPTIQFNTRWEDYNFYRLQSIIRANGEEFELNQNFRPLTGVALGRALDSSDNPILGFLGDYLLNCVFVHNNGFLNILNRGCSLQLVRTQSN